MSANEDSTDWRILLNPIVLLALIIVGSIILLIGAAVLGIDRGVLLSMSKPDYARGLVTYLFSVVTIGTAVVLVLSALLGKDDQMNERRFHRGKEILSLLLGVFGVIVGYYFGAEKAATATLPLTVSLVEVTPDAVRAGDKVTARAIVRGGAPPYMFAVAQDDDKIIPAKSVSEGGFITAELAVRKPKTGESILIHVKVEDTTGRQSESASAVKFVP